jgi:hypothetical protein
MSIDLSVIQQPGVNGVQLQISQFSGRADRGPMVQADVTDSEPPRAISYLL